MFCSISTTVRTSTRRGRDSDPDLWLERPRRNRDETDQVHVVDVHEALADRPALFHRAIRSDSLHPLVRNREVERIEKNVQPCE